MFVFYVPHPYKQMRNTVLKLTFKVERKDTNTKAYQLYLEKLKKKGKNQLQSLQTKG